MRSRDGVVCPIPRAAELAYFALVAYGPLAPAYGISVPLLGAIGLMLLAIFCVVRLNGPGNPIYSPLKLPIACMISLVLIQIFVYDSSVMDSANREFITWAMALIVIQSLWVREGFFHRAALAIGLVGLLALPFLERDYNELEGGLERAGLSVRGALANPNDLAAWFGFCCVYFLVTALEHKKNLHRMASLIAATGCFLVVGLTVSRATLGAVALAALVAIRHPLKRGFLPLFGLAASILITFQLGLFDRSIDYYLERGTVETGRLQVWPLAIERFLASPLAGVGIERIPTYVPESQKEITPHNSFLYVGLAGGMIPLLFFTLFWIRAARGAYLLSKQGRQNAPFQLPLMLYTFIIASSGHAAFMFAWASLTLCNAIPHEASGTLVLRPRKARTVEGSALRHQTVDRIARRRLSARYMRS